MLRSNSKKAAENISNYIMADIDYLQERAEYRGFTLDAEDKNAVLAFVYTIFLEEKRGEFNRYRNVNIYNIFRDWASGLALGNLFCYYYNRSAVDDLAGILEETPEEKERYTESDAEEMLTRLIFREVTRAYNRTAF